MTEERVGVRRCTQLILQVKALYVWTGVISKPIEVIPCQAPQTTGAWALQQEISSHFVGSAITAYRRVKT